MTPTDHLVGLAALAILALCAIAPIAGEVIAAIRNRRKS